MGDRVAVVSGEGFFRYTFSEDHPLNPIRVELALELIRAFGLLSGDGAVAVEPRPATDEELCRIHDPSYVEAVKLAGEGLLTGFEAARFGLGPGDNPIFPGMHEASAWIAGSSLVAAKLVSEGQFEHSFNPAGGLHHAMHDRASGFCVYNDAVLACAYLAARGLKVAYIDTDAHHGDGVQWAFYDSPQVLTISIHESGRYLFPGTGFVDEVGEGAGRGFSVNIPLPPGCFDDPYLAAFSRIVPPIVRAFAPDVIVAQCGCDGHRNDPLTHLALDITAYRAIYDEIHALAHEVCDGRLVALGGGGYDLYDAVPRVWALLFSILVERTLPSDLPEEWIAKCRISGDGFCPEKVDDILHEPPAKAREDAMAEVEKVVAEIERNVFPFFGLGRQ